MDLFNKDKEFVHKVLNGVLLIWVLAALIFTATNTIDLFIKEEPYTYNEYKALNCIYKDEETIEEDCQNSFSLYNIDNKREDHYNKLALYGSFINLIVVGTAIVILNKKK